MSIFEAAFGQTDLGTAPATQDYHQEIIVQLFSF